MNAEGDIGTSTSLSVDADTRLLVLAPHPDDETLATGGLLQRAQAARAALSVFMLTHGDNNPWPQRWLERRWRIGSEDRRRWGLRRMREAAEALGRLGVDPAILISPGWPDMGLTERMLEEGDALVTRLAGHLQAFRPTLVVMPALADRHPDHSATHLIARAALARFDGAPRCLAYLVHGPDDGADGTAVELDRGALERKRQAVLAYASQVTLSRARLLRLVTDVEHYRAIDPPPMPAAAALPWVVPAALVAWFEVLVHQAGQTWCRPVPASGRIAELFEAVPQPRQPSWFKLRSRTRTLWIFDHWGWRRHVPDTH